MRSSNCFSWIIQFDVSIKIEWEERKLILILKMPRSIDHFAQRWPIQIHLRWSMSVQVWQTIFFYLKFHWTSNKVNPLWFVVVIMHLCKYCVTFIRIEWVTHFIYRQKESIHTIVVSVRVQVINLMSGGRLSTVLTMCTDQMQQIYLLLIYFHCNLLLKSVSLC